MRKIGLLLLLILIPTVMGAAFEAQHVGDVIELQNWDITVKQILEDGSVVFFVSLNDTYNGTAVIPYQTQQSIKGVRLNTTKIFYDIYEEYRYVWYDAEILWNPKCNTNLDCNDNIACTKDYCTGEMRVCDYNNVTDCVDNDGCCPSTCQSYSDNDCKKRCTKDSGCDDNNESTSDECISNECYNNLITDCISWDEYCPDGCYWNWSNTEGRDNDCSKLNSCAYHKECDDGNASTIDICWGEKLSTEDKYCQHSLDESYISPEEIEKIEAQRVEKIEEKDEDKERMIWVTPKKLSDELDIENNTNWKLIISLSIIVLVIYFIIALRLIKVKTPLKEKF